MPAVPAALPSLSLVVLLVLVATGLAALVRAAPWSEEQKATKPLGCTACMGGHASWVVLLVATLVHAVPWPGWTLLGLSVTVGTWLAMTGGATFLLAQTGLWAPSFAPPEGD